MSEGKERVVYILSNVLLYVTVDYGWSWAEYRQILSLWEEALLRSIISGDVEIKNYI